MENFVRQKLCLLGSQLLKGEARVQKRARAFTFAELLAFLATIAAIWWLVTPDESRSSMRGYPRRLNTIEKTPYGTVVIETYPPRAHLFIDGKDSGKLSNVDVLEEITVGRHHIRMEQKGYVSAQIAVNVPANKVLRPPLVVLQKERP